MVLAVLGYRLCVSNTVKCSSEEGASASLTYLLPFCIRTTVLILVDLFVEVVRQDPVDDMGFGRGSGTGPEVELAVVFTPSLPPFVLQRVPQVVS